MQVIILVNRSFERQKNLTEERKNQKKARIKVETFPIPFFLGRGEENITITTNTASKLSKKEIINQAFKYHSQRNIQEAIKYYQYFINKGFKDHIVFFNYGLILQGQGKSEEAELSLRKAIELNPNLFNSHFLLGTILKGKKKLKEAELSLRKTIKLNPNYAKAHLTLGVILRDIRNFGDAINHFTQALKLNNQSSVVKLSLIEAKGQICDWSNKKTHDMWLKSLGIEGKSVCPWLLFSSEDNPLMHLKRSKKYYKDIYNRPSKHIESSKKI